MNLEVIQTFINQKSIFLVHYSIYLKSWTKFFPSITLANKSIQKVGKNILPKNERSENSRY